jgi:mannosyltransferase
MSRQRFFQSSVATSLILFLIAGLCLSINWITLWTQSIRLDEAQSIWVSTKSIPTIIKLISEDVHVPLYSILLHFWLQFFGNSILAARSLSLLFFVATIFPLYLTMKEATSKQLALISILMFSFSPFIAWYSNEARMYTLFTFAISLVHLFFLRFVRSGGTQSKKALVVSMIIGMYTHYFFLLILFIQGLYLLTLTYVDWSHSHETSLLKTFFKRDNLLFSYLGLLFFSGLFFLPWVIYVISGGSASNTQPLIAPPTSYNIFQTFVNFIFGFQSLSTQSDLVPIWPLSVLILFFVFTKKKSLEIRNFLYFILATFLPIVMVFLLSYIKPIFLSRYLILVTPTLYFMIAALFLHYSKKVAYSLVIAFVLVSASLLLYQNLSGTTPVKENYVGAAAYLSKYAQADDVIVLSAPFTIYPFEYSYAGAARLTTAPEWDRYVTGSIPPFSQSTFEKQIATFKKQYAHAYFVLSYDQGYEKTMKQYLDTHLQRVSLKKFSEDVEVREYVLRYDVPSRK